MNKNAKLWLEALRSGEFEQTSSVLRSEEGHCCLGVACEMYRRATGYGEWDSTERNANDTIKYRFAIKPDVYEVAGLPPTVADWLGLAHADLVALDSGYANLAEANDNGVDFHGVAELIEKNEYFLFKKDEA